MPIWMSIPMFMLQLTLPGHKDKAIGLIAHLDTATEMSGANVNARVIENYQGDDLVLNEALNIILSPSVFPALKDCIGHDLVVTDGTTLLGPMIKQVSRSSWS